MAFDQVDISEDDRRAMQAAVADFARGTLAPEVERPEEILADAALQGLTARAIEAGIVNLESEAAFGVWDLPDSQVGAALAVGALGELATVNAGVAFHFHQLGLGAWCARRLGACDGRPTAPCLQGVYGLGRDVLPAFLRGETLDAERSLWLADYFGATQPLMFQAGAGWQRAVLPSFDARDGALRWRLVDADATAAERKPHAHGLNEVDVQCVRADAAGDAPPRAVGEDGGRAFYAEVLERNALGLMAIGLGALKAGYAKAREYAEMRVQGGAKIARHPAVQLLLGRAASTISGVQATLDGLLAAPCNVGRTFAVRADVHPLLCAATNDALQAFGGIGYMRDTGIEKLVRDQNHLRVLCGTPRELRMFVAEWERP